MDVLHTLNNFVISVKDLPWGTIGQYLAASGFVSAVTLAPYKWLKNTFEQHKLWVQFLLGFVGIIVAAGHYLVTTPTTDPNIVWLQGLVLAFASQPIYIIGKIIVAKFVAGYTQAQLVADQAKTAAVPTNTTN